MADRVSPLQEKKISALNFKINLKIPLSVSGDKQVGEDFIDEAKNNNSDGSKKLKEFLFGELGIKDENDLNHLEGMESVINEARDIIYKKLNVSRMSNPFSKVMLNPIHRYLKKYSHAKD